MALDNKAIVKRLYEEVWNKRKVGLLNDLISPSHGLQSPTVFGSTMGPEGYKRQILLDVEAFPDLRFAIDEVIAEKNKVVVPWTISGTHKGEFFGIAPTNKKVSVDGITIHLISDGKIMDSTSAFDSLSLMQQLGAIPAFGPSKGATAR